MGKDVKRVGRNAIIIAVLCVVFIIGLYGTLIFGPKIIIHILFDDGASERQIKSFVQKHEEEILSCIEQGDYSALDQYDIIKKIDPDGASIDFYCGGSGFASQTNYCGFYYSSSDNLRAIWCAHPGELVPHEDGYFVQEDEGDNYYYVENICGHFYYYYSHF